MDLRRLAFVALLCLAATSACGLGDTRCQTGQDEFRCGEVDEASATLETGSDPDACQDGDDPVSLRIENRTGNAIEVVSFVRCDGSDPSEFPLMPPGLADGDDVEIPMPGPGCWLLDYAGEGCEGDMPHETQTENQTENQSGVCAGDTYVWTPDDLHHVCVG